MMTQITKQLPATPKQAARKRSPLDEHLDVDLFKALSDPTRVRLFSCLIRCGRPCSVSEVAECCNVDFSVVARHLAMLARSGVLEATKKGRTVWYSGRREALCVRLRSLADAIENISLCCVGDGEA